MLELLVDYSHTIKIYTPLAHMRTSWRTSVRVVFIKMFCCQERNSIIYSLREAAFGVVYTLLWTSESLVNNYNKIHLFVR